jgi:hypothetical protein
MRWTVMATPNSRARAAAEFAALVVRSNRAERSRKAGAHIVVRGSLAHTTAVQVYSAPARSMSRMISVDQIHCRPLCWNGLSSVIGSRPSWKNTRWCSCVQYV